ncbi:xanthine dehydrogenase accessory protein XdhC [uncultured Martelella sp.]|uniref:xanthine dehydrogenase accessory protein XdhC n=1 Tax=uncultured Martelella sp. TaxID=392331 RepID=UPI0029C9977E|nr:xanthine dehydrogenase accessory protein XdhC [uncultured Martelella sp.]
MNETATFRRFFQEHPASVIVTVAEAKGSTPREEGAVMIVSKDAICGTIGGGQLEYIAIDHARRLLSGRDAPDRLDIPLGPDIGQCCGGRTVLSFEAADARTVEALLSSLTAKAQSAPSVYVFGGGHVGVALAQALAPLPFNTTVIETRPDMAGPLPESVALRLSPMPEAEIARMPAGSAVVILTHDHALDFLIATEALKRDDLAYCGMIGSKTKRATFMRYARKEGLRDAALSRLTMPIGVGVADKRPAVIAALVASELIHDICAAKAGTLPAERAKT